MIKIDKGIVEWEKDDKENKEQIFAELFTLLDVMILNIAESSNKTETETREIVFDSHYKWVNLRENDIPRYEIAKEDFEYQAKRLGIL